jgi:uncharacterized protein
MRRGPLTLLFLTLATLTATGQVLLTDASDRAALRSWVVLLADQQFYRPTPDVTDCAALVRHALREALRPHTPEWRRVTTLPAAPVYPDVRIKTPLRDGGLALFRVANAKDGVTDAASFAEFADAKTIVRWNTRALGREVAALRPGDLLYFHQPTQKTPDHLMVFIGASGFEPEGRDWVVYHTGPNDADAGEVRKVRLRDLLRHPSPRWRPIAGNPQFVGVFRLEML